MRVRGRTDGNHRLLLDLARQLGGFVVDTASRGAGCPDAFVFSRDKGWAAVEIKTARGTLTGPQQVLHHHVPVLIWRQERDVLAHFGVMDE